MIASRKIDPALIVHSPISGKITARNAQPGYFVQPGTSPAPIPWRTSRSNGCWRASSKRTSRWLRLGQPVEAQVTAYPNRVFKGKISKLYATSDPNTHRVTIRSEINDPNDELLPGMLANFVIRVQSPAEAIAIPANGVVREGDGTMTAWVTTDRHRFVATNHQDGPATRRPGTDPRRACSAENWW